MRRKFVNFQESGITFPHRFKLFLKDGDTEGGGYDMSTKEGVSSFIKENKSVILSSTEFKTALNDELEKKKSEIEAKFAGKLGFTKDSPEWTALQKELKDYGLAIKSLSDASHLNKKGRKNLVDFLIENKEKIQGVVSHKGTSITLEYKSDVLEDATAIGSGDSFNTLGRDAYFDWHEGGKVGLIPVRKPFLREMFRKASLSGEFIKYLDQDTITRDAQNVAYCAVTSSTTQVTFKVRTVEIQKERDFIDVCLDMMNDYAFVSDQINLLLKQSLDLKIDNDLLFGTGASPDIFGMAAIASEFSAANGALAGSLNYAGTIINATLIDLISVMGAQIRQLGQQNMFYPNAVLLNPRDVQLLKSLKNSFGDYIRNNQLFTAFWTDNKGNYFIDGMLLVENPLVLPNTAWMADFTKGTVYSKPGVGIEFAYENRSNFETEVVTVKIYERLNLVVRKVDTNAFMKCSNITAAVAAITKSVNP